MVQKLHNQQLEFCSHLARSWSQNLGQVTRKLPADCHLLASDQTIVSIGAYAGLATAAKAKTKPGSNC